MVSTWTGFNMEWLLVSHGVVSAFKKIQALQKKKMCVTLEFYVMN